MSEREFNAWITEDDLGLLVMLLERHAKVCIKNATMAITNGYGSAASQTKAFGWNVKADEAQKLITKLTENAN